MTSRLSRQLPVLIIGVIVAALLAYSEEIHRQVVNVIALAEPVMASSPVFGAMVFVLLAALSAMLVFFSGLLLVPIGIQAGDRLGCFLLLWGGWFLGGFITYSIGRHFGRPAVLRMLSEEKMARYENRIPQASSFAAALLTQLVLPSDISGYFFGLLGLPGPGAISAAWPWPSCPTRSAPSIWAPPSWNGSTCCCYPQARWGYWSSASSGCAAADNRGQTGIFR